MQYIQEIRWPGGVIRCPVCGADKVTRVERNAPSKNKRGWFFLCQKPSCHNQFSPTSGTIFHDTHLPLRVWFAAIALMQNAKKVSAKQLQRDLEIGGYKTAWYLNHRIREAMQDRRSWVVSSKWMRGISASRDRIEMKTDKGQFDVVLKWMLETPPQKTSKIRAERKPRRNPKPSQP